MDNFKAWQRGRLPFLKNKTSWGPSGLIHPQIDELLTSNKDKFNNLIDEFLVNQEQFNLLGDLVENGYCSSMDAFTLFNIIKKYKPSTYFEIGSGFSTLITRKSAELLEQDIRIVSIDPKPRTEVNNVCDLVIRSKFEDIDTWEEVDKLNASDIVFIDSSHISVGYSDVSMVFSTLIPRLKPGVIIHIHDIHLPFNYMEIFKHWNEQYLLIPYLLGNYFEIIFPTFYVCWSGKFDKQLQPLGEDFGLKMGASIWLQKK